MFGLRAKTATFALGLCFSWIAAGGVAALPAAGSELSSLAKAAPSDPGDRGEALFRPRRATQAVQGTAILNIDTGELFPSIQAAIDDVDTHNGDTLVVQALLHDEGQIVINKSITLRGETGDEVIRMAVDTGSTGDARGWFLVETGVELHVRSLTFDGNGFLVYQAFRHRGTGSFRNCHFRDIQFNASGPEYRGAAIVAFGGNVDVRSCSFEDIGREGILAFGDGIFGATIEDNVYIGKGDGDFLDYGIEVGAGAVVTLRNNIITNCRGIASVDGSTSAGVLVTTFFAPGTAATAVANTLLDNAFGFLIGLAGDTSAVDAEFNRVADNTEGLRSESPSVTAENNWWGCNAGPNSAPCDSVTPTVDFDPWLVLGLSATPTSIPIEGMSQLTADMTKNSDDANTFPMGNLPDNTPMTFAGTLGSVSPPSAGTLDGMADAEFTAGLIPGTGTASATVDSQTVVVDIEIGALSPPTLFIDPLIPARANSTVDVPVQFNSGGSEIAAIVFSLDLDPVCLGFDPTDSDNDGIPDTITFELAGDPDPPSFGVTYDPADTDSELDFFIADFAPPLNSIPDGILVTVTFDTLCSPPPGDSLIVPVPFSDAPPPSFGGTDGQSVAGTSSDGSVEIFGGLAGDCNGDGILDAGDLTACPLEIFDGDGDFWLDAPGGTFAGNPVGCDANADTIIDAGDISCKVLLIFNGQGACAGSRGSSPERPELPSLDIPVTSAVGGEVILPLFFEPAGHTINSLAFALEYDPAELGFDPQDADGNGIPDAITLNAGAQTTALVAAGDSAGEIDLALLNLFGSIGAPDDGPIATIRFEILGETPPSAIKVRFSQDPEASFGSRQGQSLEGRTEDGTVLTGGLFSDDFETGDLSRWSSVIQ